MDSSCRLLRVIVLGVSVEDEYALVETTDGSQEQFFVRRSIAGEAWYSLQHGAITWLVVTSGLAGRVLEVRSMYSGSA